VGAVHSHHHCRCRHGEPRLLPPARPGPAQPPRRCCQEGKGRLGAAPKWGLPMCPVPGCGVSGWGGCTPWLCQALPGTIPGVQRKWPRGCLLLPCHAVLPGATLCHAVLCCTIDVVWPQLATKNHAVTLSLLLSSQWKQNQKEKTKLLGCAKNSSTEWKREKKRTIPTKRIRSMQCSHLPTLILLLSNKSPFFSELSTSIMNMTSPASFL